VNGSQRRERTWSMRESGVRVDAPVIIVGGGPVGLSLALGLARYEVCSILLERNIEPVAESRAMVLWARSLEILRDYRAYDALRKAGTFLTCVRTMNARTETQLLSIDFSMLNDVVEDPGALVLPQQHTERVLRELVAASPLCDLRTGVEATALRQEQEFVEVRVRGSSGEHVLRSSFAVGCDGARGIVRPALGLSLEGITYDSRIVLSDEMLEEDPPIDAIARTRLDKPGIRFAIRFAPRTWRVIASVDKELDDQRALSESAHQERLCELFGSKVRATTLWSSIFKVHRRHAQRFFIGRVALAGDAAHLNSPAGGQGMNAGIQDAANLAWKLALALRGHGDTAMLLDSYDAERREMVTDTIERYVDRLTRAGLGFSPRTKQFVVRAVSRAVRMYGMQCKLSRALGMLTGRYTRSPIVDARHALAGRRIDDILLPDGTRISTKRTAWAAIVVAGEYDPGIPHVAVPIPPKRWHVKGPLALIVRPDGCVASVVEKPTRGRIEAAWHKAFCGALPLPEAAIR
jgi:2-polyprenyl-6-methoxyphenol hydroxylase-like FAD-dependent oxidoreductase